MNEGEAHAASFNCDFLLGQRGDRLAAKRSTKVAQKNEKQRRFRRKAPQRLSGL